MRHEVSGTEPGEGADGSSEWSAGAAAVRVLRKDEGSTLLLTIFYGFLCLVLVLIVVAATSLYLERKRLFTLADGAALAGAESFSLADVETGAAVAQPELTTARVRDAVTDYLEDAPDVDFTDLALRRAITLDGRSATVTIAAMWRPPMISLLVPEGVPIEVTATARSVLH